MGTSGVCAAGDDGTGATPRNASFVLTPERRSRTAGTGVGALHLVDVRNVCVGDGDEGLLHVCDVGERLGRRDRSIAGEPRTGRIRILTIDLVAVEVDEIAGSVSHRVRVSVDDTGRSRVGRGSELRLKVLVAVEGLIPGMPPGSLGSWSATAVGDGEVCPYLIA